MSKISLEAGEHTEELLQFILDEVGDEALDDIDVDRTLVESPGLAGEAVTAAVILGLAVPATIGVVRIVERWLEKKRQEDNLVLVLKGFEVSKEAGVAMAGLAGTHAKVAVEYSLYDAQAAGEK